MTPVKLKKKKAQNLSIEEGLVPFINSYPTQASQEKLLALAAAPLDEQQEVSSKFLEQPSKHFGDDVFCGTFDSLEVDVPTKSEFAIFSAHVKVKKNRILCLY